MKHVRAWRTTSCCKGRLRRRCSRAFRNGALTGLSTPLGDLVDTHLFAAISDEVEELSLQTLPKGTKIELARKGEGWHERAPTDRDLTVLEAEMANALAKTVVGTTGEIIDPKPRLFPLHFASPLRAASHTSLRRSTSSTRPRIESPTTPFSICRPTAYRRLEPRVSAFQSAVVWPQSLEGARVDQLSDDCSAQKQVVVRDALDQFHFQTPLGYRVDSANVIALAEAIEHLRATSWVADTDDGSFGTRQGCLGFDRHPRRRR